MGMTAQEAARVLNRYARRHSGGAFASPTARELVTAQADGRLHVSPGVVMVERPKSARTVELKDWTGRPYPVAAFARCITHLAAEPGAVLPDLLRYELVNAYMEDDGVVTQLHEQGRRLRAVRISASAEIIGAWGRGAYREYPAEDMATLVQLENQERWELAAREARGLDGWFDDYPFYSDGTWGALSLRGFYPEDPTKGIKPSEMNRKWKAEHTRDLMRSCGWTKLAESCPGAVDLAMAAAETACGQYGDVRMERVRFLRMAGTVKGGKLGRHTDITDKSSGTRNDQIFRVHVPLITSRGAKMTVWNLHGKETTAHLPSGTAWYLDARKPHAVVNETDQDRIHLVVDLRCNEVARARIIAGTDLAA